MKLQYMKNTSVVAHFHIMMVSINRNMFKQARVINKLGRFGTGVPLAPVLLFELFLAINNSSTSHSSRRQNTSTLRIITLRERRILPLYGSLPLLCELLLSTGNTPALRVTLRVIPGHLRWRVGFVEIRKELSGLSMRRVGRLSSPVVRRARVQRPLSGFSNWFTYE